MLIDDILKDAVEQGASDVLLKPGAPPCFRIGPDLAPNGSTNLESEEVHTIVDMLFDEYRRKQFATQLQADLAYESELGRFRVNVFRQRGEMSVVIRVIPAEIRTISDLNLPSVVERIAEERRGLVLVTGATGSGKSTTLAAIINHINNTRAAHVITIEDPIEYVHEDRKSHINQREVGYDTVSFASALKAALRQNPDVILVGEMRDLETMETAILAAETGHLVLSTLHTLDAPQTITRAIGVFPEHQRDQIRLILSTVLRGIVSQRLIPRGDGKGQVPAVEVLVSTERVRECLADKQKTRDLREVIAQGHTAYGMQTFDQSLMALYKASHIAYDEALMYASNPADFALKVSGLSSTSDGRWKEFEGGADGRSGIEIERF